MKKVLLLGAGYANLSLIKALDKSVFSKAEFTLISQTKFHYLSVLLHEVVSGFKKEQVLFDINELLPPQVQFIEDTIVEIKEKEVLTQNSTYLYDILVVGLGFQSDTFGIEGIKEHAFPIINYHSALSLNEKITERILDYKKGDNTALHFIVCGGGFSGVELIASLAEELPKRCMALGVETKDITLTCVEAMPNILPMFSNNLVNIASTYLQSLGIHLATACKILQCEKDGIIVEENGQKRKINASLIIWTAGVKGNEVIQNSSFFTQARSKVEVNAYLQPINQKNNMNNIFILGDCAALKDPLSGRFYPPTAQIAAKQGKYLARVLEAKLENQAFDTEFSYEAQGTICSLGAKNAVGVLGKKELKGKIALWLKHLVEARWRFVLQGIKGIFH
ncbi:NAD(P)/FAD-dependent oxidoreductase [Helicobacter sp. MIT 14-3879]|uniref:NAD(P)/FAD-dependent oxidoreductase n=1 Tax=Helicobacter sp. MIT 14-3879 TaxID=2040649 RepID=UPI000E1EBD03|nr:NAD(P)/FAD-dependent oxidoreductase [Helicobacter sp. MIT 14-3879]RDU63185.1 NAD(P)/FAD-dependent oxidoreductase [Helicobacter sp. MIT 14-3879]